MLVTAGMRIQSSLFLSSVDDPISELMEIHADVVTLENVNQKEQTTTSASAKMAITSMRRLELAYQFVAYVSAFYYALLRVKITFQRAKSIGYHSIMHSCYLSKDINLPHSLQNSIFPGMKIVFG